MQSFTVCVMIGVSTDIFLFLSVFICVLFYFFLLFSFLFLYRVYDFIIINNNGHKFLCGSGLGEIL